jgi:thymidylate synthase (FAD)
MKNRVELIGHYGSDLTHAQSAWTSTSRELTEEKQGRIPKLLKMLAEEGHHTPFEKSSFHFLVTVDQATHIHLLKHRIGVSINGESARYKELKEDKFYVPGDWIGVRPDSFSVSDWAVLLHEHTEASNKLYHKALESLTPVLGRKRAKESARFFKTMNSQITMDVMFNWRSFAHFYNLRASEHAQKEVRELAIEMLEKIKAIDGQPFKHTIEAFSM